MTDPMKKLVGAVSAALLFAGLGAGWQSMASDQKSTKERLAETAENQAAIQKTVSDLVKIHEIEAAIEKDRAERRRAEDAEGLTDQD